MYFVLAKNLALRSYDNKPFVILNKKNKSTLEVSEFIFEALKLCDGSNDLACLPVYEHLLKYDIIKINDEKEVPCLDYKKYDNRYFQALWSITRNCNFRCKHCFVTNSAEKAFKEFTTKECLHIIDEFKSCGIDTIAFIGGEPLVRKDFWQIVDYMIDKDILLNCIYTNASLVDEVFLEKIKERHLNPVFYVSFDGVGYHDFVRNRVGAEKEVIEKIKLIISKGFKVVCTMAIFKGNLSSIMDTIDLLSNIGVYSLRVQPILPTTNWIATGCDFVTNDGILQCGLEVLKALKDKPIDMSVVFFSWYTATKDKIILFFKKNENVNSNLLTCDFWRNSIFVTPEGKVVPCPMIDFDKFFDADVMTEKPLKDILNDKKYLNLINIDVKALSKKDKCDKCNMKQKCESAKEICLAPSYFRTGNLKTRDPKAVCEFFDKYVNEYEKIAREYNSKAKKV